MSQTETPSLTTEMIRDVSDLKTVIVINGLSFSFESLVDILLFFTEIVVDGKPGALNLQSH